MESLKSLKNKVLSLDNKLWIALGDLTLEIQEKTDFEIYLTIFPDDGLAVMRQSELSGISIDDALDIISRKGRLTDDDWTSYL